MTNIPKTFQDYDDTDPQIELRKNRWNYWNSLKLARKEYMRDIADLGGQFDAWDFEDYLKENYGIKLNLLDGNITDNYEITDEKKYMVFLLKFASAQ